MAKILGLLGVPLLITGLCWLGSVIYLQESRAEVSESALLVYFILLPLALIGLWLGAKFALKAARKKTAADAADNASAPAAAATVTPKASPLQVLAAELHCMGGEDPAQVLTSLVSAELQPVLDAALPDTEGLPLHLAKAPELDESPWQEKVQAWTVSGEENSVRLDPEQGARMLALLDGPLTRMLETLANLPPAQQNTPDASLQRLSIKLFAPQPWQELLAGILRERIAQLERFAVGFIRHDPQRPELHQDPLRIAAAFAADTAALASNGGKPETEAPRRGLGDLPLLMLVACDSLCTEGCIEQLGHTSRLFSANNQQGIIPGEAAALILLSPAQNQADSLPPLAILQAVRDGSLSKSIDETRRPGPELLGSLLAEFQQLVTPLPEASAVISDCDQRAARNTEVAAFITAHLAELDAVADHLAIGRSLGDAGCASAALTLALGAHHAQQQSSSLLLASVRDPKQRSLALLTASPDTNT